MKHSLCMLSQLERWLPALLLLIASGAGRVGGAGSEPFLTHNQSPISRLYGLPPAEAVPPNAEPGFSAAAAVDIANISFERVRDDRVLILDGETWCIRLALGHQWANGWRTTLQVPYVMHRGGSTDGFIEWYHDALNLPQGNRAWRESGLLEYRYWQMEQDGFSLTDSASGVGDVRLALSAPLWRDRGNLRSLDVMAGLELPTGDSGRLLGSGSTDVSLGLAGWDESSLSRWRMVVQAAAGLLVMTKGDVLPELQRTLGGYGHLSLGWQMTSWLQPRVQADGHSPLFSGTEMPPLDSWSLQLVMGARARLPGRFTLDVAVVEDILVETAPDVVFHFRISRPF